MKEQAWISRCEEVNHEASNIIFMWAFSQISEIYLNSNTSEKSEKIKIASAFYFYIGEEGRGSWLNIADKNMITESHYSQRQVSYFSIFIKAF